MVSADAGQCARRPRPRCVPQQRAVIFVQQSNEAALEQVATQQFGPPACGNGAPAARVAGGCHDSMPIEPWHESSVPVFRPGEAVEQCAPGGIEICIGVLLGSRTRRVPESGAQRLIVPNLNNGVRDLLGVVDVDDNPGSSTTSGACPTRVVTSGTPEAIDSSTALGRPPGVTSRRRRRARGMRAQPPRASPRRTCRYGITSRSSSWRT